MIHSSKHNLCIGWPHSCQILITYYLICCNPYYRLLFSSTMKRLSPFGPEPPSMSGIFKGTQRYRQIAKLAGTEDSTDPILLNTDVRRAIMGVEYMAKRWVTIWAL